jgi:hypothetical protein
MDPEGAPVGFGQVPVIAGEFGGHFFGNAGRTEQFQRPRGYMVVADDGIDPHEVVHVGMGNEKRVDGFHDALGKVVGAAAVDKDPPPRRPDVQQEKRIIEKAREKSRFNGAERKAGSHLIPSSAPSPHPLHGR